MIEAHDFDFVDASQEKLAMDQLQFPYACYFRSMQPRIQTEVPWHWHDAFEVELIKQGTITLFDQTTTHQLKEGDLCLIRPQALHALKSDHCEFYAHLFAPDFLSGDRVNRIWQTYFASMIKEGCPDVLVFEAGEANTAMIQKWFLKAVTTEQQRTDGWELQLKAELLMMWQKIHQAIKLIKPLKTHLSSIQSHRIRQMLQLIADHYDEPLTLNQIAQSAGVSPQECMRCFRKRIGQSPIQYLTNYRTHQAAQMLANSELSILQISLRCGFNSSSYFAKVFRASMHCSPREYRKRLQA